MLALKFEINFNGVQNNVLVYIIVMDESNHHRKSVKRKNRYLQLVCYSTEYISLQVELSLLKILYYTCVPMFHYWHIL